MEEHLPNEKRNNRTCVCGCQRKSWDAIYTSKRNQKNQHESLIIFGCHNLKKLGLSKQRLGLI